MKTYDLIIIGAGPAGLTAGLYAVRSGLKTAIISKDIGGTTNSILKLENWPGFEGSGGKLMKQFYDQLRKYEIDFVMKNVDLIEKDKSKFLVVTGEEKFQSSALIIAGGTERKKLNVPGEEKFLGKGISYCVTCDGFFFKNKIVAVIGGSDCAAISALALADIAKKVYVVYRGEKLRCEEVTNNKLKEKANVEIIYNLVPKKIEGVKNVEKLIVDKNGKEREIKVDGIFVEIGATPITKFIDKLNLKLDKEKYIVVNDNMETSVKGIFAAGDCTNQKLKQVVVASGQGAIAGKSAYDFLKKP